MLVSLRIRNLALIEDLTWELGPGFNTLTGETGAGKSILIDALSLLLGERADKTLIRTGAETCSVEAEIRLEDKARLKQIDAALEEIGAEPCEGGHPFAQAQSFGGGCEPGNSSTAARSRCRDSKASADLLVDVHGPHDHQSLLATEKQAELLDAYGKLAPLRAACGAAYRRVARDRAGTGGLGNERKRTRAKALAFAASGRGNRVGAPSTGRGHAGSRTIIGPLRTHRIFSSRPVSSRGFLNDSENSVLTQLAQVERALTAWQRMDDSIADAETMNRQAIVQLQDLLAIRCRRGAERVDLDPAQLRQLEDRLNLVQGLKRKYGGTIEAVLGLRRKSRDPTGRPGRPDRIFGLVDAAREKVARSALEKAAAELSRARGKIASPLGEKISQELRALGFKQALFARSKSLRLRDRAPWAATKWNLFSRPTRGKRPVRYARLPRAARWPVSCWP